MDIDLPHRPIESKREFFLHLFTITCGLLIALTLEGLVEMAHHHSLVVEARANIRRELNDNQKATAEDIRFVQEDADRFRENLEYERALRSNPGAHGGIHSTFSWGSTEDSAWRTARDTGALAYMPYDEVQRYADVYAQQDIANSTAIVLFRQQVEAVAPMATGADSADLSKEEVERLIHDSATVYLDLRTLGQILTQLRDEYGATLKAK